MKSLIHNASNSAMKKAFGEGIFYKHAVVKYRNFLAWINRLTSRKSARYFDFLQVDNASFPDVFYCHEHYYQNSLYGIAPTLRCYAKYDHKICACIEHGVYFGDYINSKEVTNNELSGIITFSQTRKEHIQVAKDVDVYPIGPYIQYSKCLLSDKEIENTKKQFGKTLIAFPSHSVTGSKTDYDINKFISELLAIKEKEHFNTVLINLYYTDIINGSAEIYCSNGFRVTSAGNRFDPLFLARLRTLIELSDFSISNSCGTHVGYCVALGVPHAIFQQNTSFIIDSSAELINQNNSNLRHQEIEEVLNAFPYCISSEITENQKNVCEKYWGLGIKQSPKEMNQLLAKLSTQFNN